MHSKLHPSTDKEGHCPPIKRMGHWGPRFTKAITSRNKGDLRIVRVCDLSSLFLPRNSHSRWKINTENSQWICTIHQSNGLNGHLQNISSNSGRKHIPSAGLGSPSKMEHVLVMKSGFVSTKELKWRETRETRQTTTWRLSSMYFISPQPPSLLRQDLSMLP